MHIRISCVAPMLMAFALFGDTAGDRVKILGRWVAEDASAKHEIWLLEEKGDLLHVLHSKGDEKVADYTCNTRGQDCDVRLGKDKAKVSLYFNGPMLVQMETQGSEVSKRRFSVLDGGQTLQIEVIPIVSSDKPETLRFKRAPEGDASPH